MLLADAGFFDVVELLKQYGPFCGVLILATAFSMWRDFKREERMTKRITMLEDDTRKILLPLIQNCADVIARNTAVMERLERHLNL